MWHWYEEAEQCWVYLADVQSPKKMRDELGPRSSVGTLDDPLDWRHAAYFEHRGAVYEHISCDNGPPYLSHTELDELLGDLKASLSFTRGWTLQELIAPRVVVFWTQQWTCINGFDKWDE